MDDDDEEEEQEEDAGGGDDDGDGFDGFGEGDSDGFGNGDAACGGGGHENAFAHFLFHRHHLVTHVHRMVIRKDRCKIFRNPGHVGRM